jgi:hypothetical protein
MMASKVRCPSNNGVDFIAGNLWQIMYQPDTAHQIKKRISSMLCSQAPVGETTENL